MAVDRYEEASPEEGGRMDIHDVGGKSMTVHELKSHPEFFQAVLSRRKTFEVRKDDRGYLPGDILILREYNPTTKSFTGRSLEREITYISALESYPVSRMDTDSSY